MQGSSYAPLQFLRSPWNRDVYTAIDNQVDGRTTLVLYLGAASSLPDELQKYNVGCILIHKDEKQIYLNTGNDTTPTWQAFGPGTNSLPTPFVSGQYLTNDGVDAFWSLIDLATGVTGLLDSDHIDLSDLANNSDFIDYLIGNSYFTTSLANDSNFLTNLITNLNTGGLLAVVTDGVTITGDGTTLDPLVAVGNGALPLDVQLNGASVENPVGTINFIAPSGTVTSPSTGVVDVDLNSLIIGTGGSVERISNVENSNNKFLFINDYLLQFPSTTTTQTYLLYKRDPITAQYICLGQVSIGSLPFPLDAALYNLSTDGVKLYGLLESSAPNSFAIIEIDITTGNILTSPCVINTTYLTGGGNMQSYFISGGKAYLQQQNTPYTWGECPYVAGTSQTLVATTFSIPTTGLLTYTYPLLNTLGDYALFNESSGVNILKKVQISTNTITTYTYSPVAAIAHGAAIIGNKIAVARLLTRGSEYDIEIAYISN